MSSLYSPYWYRVATLRPQLHKHTKIHRHFYRGERWYVLKDSSAARYHRFNSTAYHLIGLMDGRKTVQEIWDTANKNLGDAAPTQDETIRLLGRLYSTDILKSDVAPDMFEMFERQQRKQASSWKQKTLNPFSLRIPLINPDNFLKKWMFLVKPFIGWAGFSVWLLAVAAGCILAITNWPELSENVVDRVLAPTNLVVLWLTFPIIKLIHELAHAFVIKIWGGEVNEMGIMIMAFTPIPYVEASSSAAFADKQKRMAVAAAGMAVELLMACLALALWLNIEPGLVSAIAYNIILIGGVSTILFNGNPLLRFDGYYVLADGIEIPNLGQRSIQYLGYLIQTYLVGVENVRSPVSAQGEGKWFLFYGILSFAYRMLILIGLILFISNKFFFIGILIAVWGITTQIVLPSVRNCSRFINSAGGRSKQGRLLLVSLGLLIVIGAVMFAVPVPMSTRAEGVVWLPEYSQVRSGTSCFISKVLVEEKVEVKRGDPLIQCEDPLLATMVQVQEANAREILARYHAEPLHSQVKREILKNKLASMEADRSRTRERLQELTIRSPNNGLLVIPGVHTLVGRFVNKGDLLGYVMNDYDLAVNVVVSQADVSLVQNRTEKVEILLADRLNNPITTIIKSEVPAASDRLPSAVLGITGGGLVPVDPMDPKGLKTLKRIFQFQLELPIAKENIKLGGRVYVLFIHGYEPLALQWYRSLRQLFLRQFQI